MEKISRREFLRRSLLGIIAIKTSSILLDALIPEEASALEGRRGLILKKEAIYYKRLKSKRVRCLHCPHRCLLEDGKRGFCRARENNNGTLYSYVWSNPCAIHIDPIEKKPLFHYLPGSKVFSIATAGCNFRCKYCQNWEIAQFPPEDTINYRLYPKDVIRWTKEQGCRVIAYTYSEPVTFYEYMLDTCRLARREGIKNTYHSNGYINSEPLAQLSRYLDAANIDLKGFTDSFYKTVCAGKLSPVLNTIKTLKENGVWVEITNLIVPTKNDDMKKIKEMCRWIRNNLGRDQVVHFSRFFPMYKLKHLPPTPIPTLERAREVALEVGLQYVYIGNVFGHKGENTYCPNCKRLLIHRKGYSILSNNIVKGRCKFCKYKIVGVWI